MPDGRSKRPPAEALVDLRRRLSLLPARDPARKEAVTRAADLFGISVATLYRCLREQLRPKSVRRADHGVPVALRFIGVCFTLGANRPRLAGSSGREP